MELDEGRKAAWRMFLTAHTRLLDRIERDLAAEGRDGTGAVPWEWYDILLTLEEADGGRLRMGELADAVLVSRSALTRLVDKLEAQGYLKREASASDRRATEVTLTETGQAARERTWPTYRAAIVQYFARFVSEEESEIMQNAFRRMLEAG